MLTARNDGGGDRATAPRGVVRTVTNGLQWFAIQTRSRYEKRVTADLREKAVEAYLPVRSVEHQWSDRRKVVDLPLFPGYVFVKISGDAPARVPVLQTDGVLGFLGVRGIGVPIPDEEMAAIQTVLREKIPVEPHPFVKVGEKVRICGGSLDGLEGLLAGVEGKENLVVSIDLIERSVVIRISGFKVVPVSAGSQRTWETEDSKRVLALP
ncbi:MAG: UpxY family transcription antiterminator [Candidatus Acidiferrum sp.]